MQVCVVKTNEIYNRYIRSEGFSMTIQKCVCNRSCAPDPTGELTSVP